MKEINIAELMLNPMLKIADEWMLITAGNKDTGFNTMTASWGHLGSLWGHSTAVVYIRPQRFTKEFVDREEYFTLSFFPGEYHKALGYLGSHSGRDGDKITAAGLTPVFEGKAISFEEADLTLVCRKLYRATLTEEGFCDKSILGAHYSQHDMHDMYVGEIVKVYTK